MLQGCIVSMLPAPVSLVYFLCTNVNS